MTLCASPCVYMIKSSAFLLTNPSACFWLFWLIVVVGSLKYWQITKVADRRDLLSARYAKI